MVTSATAELWLLFFNCTIGEAPTVIILFIKKEKLYINWTKEAQRRRKKEAITESHHEETDILKDLWLLHLHFPCELTTKKLSRLDLITST